MKKIIFFLLLSMVTVLSAEAHKHRNRNVQVSISIQNFYDELSPYGDWIYSHDYGYVWRPYFENPDAFRPYSSGGHWVYTNYGWTWVSDYRWGWATFHYGRWDFDNYLGWLWIPGTEWAPAWVTWGEYDNYWGWAPMGPNIYVQTNWYAPDPWWTFVPRTHFCSHNWNRYIYNKPVHVTHITHITNIYVDNNNSRNDRRSWYNGPRASDVERYSRERVRAVEVVDNDRAENSGIRNNRLNVYRPEVKTDRSESRPSEYRNAEQVRTGRKIEQTNARSNDPGATRTRTSMEQSRNQQQNQATPDKGSRKSSIEQRGASAPSNDRNPEMRGGQTQPTRSGSQTDPRMGPQVYPERNTSRSSESQREPGNRESNNRENEKSKPAVDNNRNKNTEYSQPRNSSPDLNKVYSRPAREQENTPKPAVKPNREQKPQREAPAANTRSEQQERKPANREENRQNERRKASENERGSTSNPPRK